MPSLFANFKSSKKLSKALNHFKSVRIVSIDDSKIIYLVNGKGVVIYYNEVPLFEYPTETHKRAMIIEYKNEVFDYYKKLLEKIKGEHIDKIIYVSSEAVAYEKDGVTNAINSKGIEICINNASITDYKNFLNFD